ncbi:MAG TPA: response regulator transcription factor [Candidatus Binataceae bacterium]|nr:response regulator transcription factor [Candidatus Binataceae bacterium]
MPIRLIIADDHALFRQGLISLLMLQPDVEVVAEVDRAGKLPAVMAELACDIVLLDLQLERWSMDDIPALAEKAAVIVLTASESVENGMMALRFGARAIVQKRFAIETLVTAIHAVAEGHVWMPPVLQAAFARSDTAGAKRLTIRESEIVRFVAMGMRNAEVAEALSVSENTVKTHLTNVFQKLGIRDRMELTHYAIRTGLVAVQNR